MDKEELSERSKGEAMGIYFEPDPTHLHLSDNRQTYVILCDVNARKHAATAKHFRHEAWDDQSKQGV